MEFNKSFIKIVASFIKTGNYDIKQLDNILKSVYESLENFSKYHHIETTKTHLYDDHFVCLMCNKSVVLLNKHLTQVHDTTIDKYRQQFGLANDYPSVPKNYSKKRSGIAKTMKLGVSNRKKK